METPEPAADTIWQIISNYPKRSWRSVMALKKLLHYRLEWLCKQQGDGKTWTGNLSELVGCKVRTKRYGKAYFHIRAMIADGILEYKQKAKSREYIFTLLQPYTPVDWGNPYNLTYLSTCKLPPADMPVEHLSWYKASQIYEWMETNSQQTPKGKLWTGQIAHIPTYSKRNTRYLLSAMIYYGYIKTAKSASNSTPLHTYKLIKHPVKEEMVGYATTISKSF